MSTYMPKPAEVSRKWYVLDAADKPLGRVAAQAAHILRGKHKPTFAPHVDCGDHVIIINCEKAVLTGKKLENKKFYWHTGWIGGIKSVSYKELMETKPEKAMMIAVNGMLPNNSQGRNQLKRLRTYRNSAHKHEAQKPVAYPTPVSMTVFWNGVRRSSLTGRISGKKMPVLPDRQQKTL